MQKDGVSSHGNQTKETAEKQNESLIKDMLYEMELLKLLASRVEHLREARGKMEKELVFVSLEKKSAQDKFNDMINESYPQYTVGKHPTQDSRSILSQPHVRRCEDLGVTEHAQAIPPHPPQTVGLNPENESPQEESIKKWSTIKICFASALRRENHIRLSLQSVTRKIEQLKDEKINIMSTIDPSNSDSNCAHECKSVKSRLNDEKHDPAWYQDQGFWIYGNMFGLYDYLENKEKEDNPQYQSRIDLANSLKTKQWLPGYSYKHHMMLFSNDDPATLDFWHNCPEFSEYKANGKYDYLKTFSEELVNYSIAHALYECFLYFMNQTDECDIQISAIESEERFLCDYPYSRATKVEEERSAHLENAIYALLWIKELIKDKIICEDDIYQRDMLSEGSAQLSTCADPHMLMNRQDLDKNIKERFERLGLSDDFKHLRCITNIGSKRRRHYASGSSDRATDASAPSNQAGDVGLHNASGCHATLLGGRGGSQPPREAVKGAESSPQCQCVLS